MMQKRLLVTLHACVFVCSSCISALPQRAGGKQLPIKSSISDLDREIAATSHVRTSPEVKNDLVLSTFLEHKYQELVCQRKELEIQRLLGPHITRTELDTFGETCRASITDPAGAGQTESSTTASSTGSLAVAVPAWCTEIPISYSPDSGQEWTAIHSVVKPPVSLPTNETALTWGSSGREITTKRTVYLAYVNRVRYDVELGGITTITPMPVIPSDIFSFGSAVPAAAPKNPGAAFSGVRAAITPADQWASLQECLGATNEALSTLVETLNGEESALNTYKTAISDRLTNASLKVSSSIDEERGYADDSQSQLFPDHAPPAWPSNDFQHISAMLNLFKTKYAELLADPAFNAWKIKNHPTEDLSKDADESLTMVGHYTAPDSSNSEESSYNAAREFIDSWHDQFTRVANANDDFFVKHFNVSCRNWFGQGSKTQMQLTTHDRLNPNSKDEVTNLDVAVCNSAITITSGLGLSFVTDRTPAFQPIRKIDPVSGKVLQDANGNPLIVQSLGFSSEAKVHPAYSVQENTAIKETDALTGFGFHWGVGALLTGTTGGAAIDVLTGPSFSFRRRTIFVSPYYDLGKRTDYVSQFKPGDVQGNLTSPPTEQRWKSGFGLTITFPFSVGNPTTNSSQQSATSAQQPNGATTSKPKPQNIPGSPTAGNQPNPKGF